MLWGDLDPDSDVFTLLNMLIPYGGGISTQFLQKLAENTGYNFRHSDQNLFLLNEAFTVGADKTYDSDRIYTGKYIAAKLRGQVGTISLPYEWDEQNYPLEFILLTTSYQTFAETPAFEIKTEAGGGITLRVTAGTTVYVSGTIIELRRVVGT